MRALPDRSLADAQADLIAALGGGAAVPPGFAVDRVAAMAAVLARKRLRAVRRVSPPTGAELGNQLSQLFSDYARATPPPSDDAVDDALAFIRWLEERGTSTRILVREALQLRCRRGSPVVARWLLRERTLVVAWRDWNGHVRYFTVG